MSADRTETSDRVISQAVESLQKVLADLRAKPASSKPEDWNLDQLVAAKAAVIPHYGAMFSPANIGKLSRETVLEFLQFKNNRHWKGLERSGPQFTKNMNRLREAIALLVDESEPLRSRLERLRPREGRAMVPFLGPAVITAILHVVYSDRYGVFNATLKTAMESLEIWPRGVGEDSLADQYMAVNPIQLELAAQLGLDLWTLDYLWWYVARHASPAFSDKNPQPSKDRRPDQGKLPPTTLAPNRQTAAAQSFSVPSGLTFTLAEAESKLLRFCREEYIYYDGIADQVPGCIEPIDVLATVSVNSFVNSAALVHKVHRGLASRCDTLLAKIPIDADLMSYDSELTEFQRLIHAAVQAPQVLVAVATKVLHRKRRNFVPMIDSVLIKHYATAWKHPEWIEKSQVKSAAAEVAVDVTKAFREDLQHAYTRLIALRAGLAQAGFVLTPVRILEILMWTETEPSNYYRIA